MREFATRMTVPPGGYFYKVPETGDEVLGGTLMQAVDMVRKIYFRNKIAIPSDLSARVEHFICLHVPESFCKGEYEPGDEQFRVINPREIRNEATKLTRIKLKWGSEKFLAPIELSEKRARVCAGCGCNARNVCTTCNGLKDYVVKAIGSRTTSVDSQLGVCSVCSCIAKAKVHISVEALREVRPVSGTAAYPDHCWMVKEGII